MAGISPTSHSLALIRDNGFTCDVVERFIKNPAHPAGGFRRDFLGFADIIGIDKNSIIAVQSCGSAFSEHHKKLIEDEKANAGLMAFLQNEQATAFLIGWRKVKLFRGSKAVRWKPRIRKYYIDFFTKEFTFMDVDKERAFK